ncbi:MAG: amino acid-binding protein [Eggerthellaceae bacterium]|nr:amino acid-binding protein [Eggerthellaceae bacterium]
MIDQITVFLENSEGRLSALCRTLADADVSMSALTIADTTDYGVVRIICDDPGKALEVLNDADYRAVATKVSAIAVPNEAGGLARLLETLDSLKLNIEYGYCFSINGDHAVDVLKIRGTEQASEAANAIEAAGFKLLQQSDIA